MYKLEIMWTFDGKYWRTIIVKKKINLKKYTGDNIDELY